MMRSLSAPRVRNTAETRTDMRSITFKMERPGKLQEGQRVIVTEGSLPSNYFYSIGIEEDPFLAMSPNIPFTERLTAKEGVVKQIVHNDRGFYVEAEFED